MKTQKLYFKDTDDTFCTSLQSRLEYAKDEGLNEITLVEAIPDDINTDMIWCTHYGEVTERQLCTKAECPKYESKSGRGVCSNRGKLYLHGDEKTFKID